MRVDTDLRIAIADVAGAQGPVSPGRRKKDPDTIPRVAKVSFTIGLSLLGSIILLPLLSRLLRAPDAAPAPQASSAPAPARPQAPKPATPAAESGGGGSLSVAGAPEEAPRVEAPMPAPALRVLTGLWTFLNDASHPSPGRPLGRLDPRSDYFPPGTLDVATPDVFEGLELSQLRVARQPAAALRVTACRTNSSGFEFDIELVGSGKNGDEVVSRGRVAMVPVDDEVMRLTRVEPLEPFETTGARLGPQSFEQGTASADPAPEKPAEAPRGVLPPARQEGTRETSRIVATYPFIIR
jgi:hypothetical protein